MGDSPIVIALFFFLNQSPRQTQQTKESSSLGEQVDWQIVGIEPGAGIMINTEKAMKEYGLEEAGWKLQESGSAAMMTAFQDAITNNDPIVATLWEPHALFSIADIRKLEDPKNVYNNPEATTEFLEEFAPDWADAQVASDVIATVVYQGFNEDAPAAYAFFKNFNIPSDVQSDWIFQYTVEEKDPEDIAKAYIEANQELVESWKPSSDVALGKETIVIGIPPWPGVTVKSRIMAQILQEMGYETEIQEVDVGVVYTGLADKQIDVNPAGWLPSTHGEYWNTQGEQLEIAGINITNTWLGLGVPAYVDESIQSLEDLAL